MLSKTPRGASKQDKWHRTSHQNISHFFFHSTALFTAVVETLINVFLNVFVDQQDFQVQSET